MGLKARLDLAEQIAKYAKACGKTHILQTLPQDLSKIDTCGLKLAPKLEGDLVQLSLKPKIIKGYRARQIEDIAKYGEKKVDRVGVTDAMLERFTPHRRLSNKPCTLKNPKEYEYFISKYEKEMGVEFLPEDWEKLTNAQKYDLIVKDRYSRLVSNKIMDSIQHEHVEHSFDLNKDGDIVGYSLGDNISVKPAKAEFDGTSIHNHPHSFRQTGFKDLEIEILPNEFCKNTPRSMTSHSAADIVHAYIAGGKHYVVDSNGNKFLMQANNMPCSQPCINVLSGNLSAHQQSITRYSSSEAKKLIKEIFQLNDELKKLDKGSNEYKNIAEKLKQKIYQYHEEIFNDATFFENKRCVDMYSEVFRMRAKRTCGMRLIKVSK